MSIFSSAQYFPIFYFVIILFLVFFIILFISDFSYYFKLVFAYLILSGIVFSCYYSD